MLFQNICFFTWCILQKMLPLNSMTYLLYSSSCNPSRIQITLFESKLLSHFSNEQDHLLKNVKNLGFNKKVNVSTESTKKLTCYSSLQFILFKMSINMSFYNKHSFSRFRTHFNGRPKIMTYRQVFQKIIVGTRPSYKK